MLGKTTLAGLAVAGILAFAPTGVSAAALHAGSADLKALAGTGNPVGTALEQVQYGRGHYRGGPGYYRGGPGPGWGYRPWYRRPYYGTILGGIALGSIIAVTAYGMAPPRPRPDLCWYWSDRNQSRGYWDYC